MRHPLALPAPIDRDGLRVTLIEFGMAVVRELSRPEVLATYRLAILEAENAPEVALTLDNRTARAACTTMKLVALCLRATRAICWCSSAGQSTVTAAPR